MGGKGIKGSKFRFQIKLCFAKSNMINISFFGGGGGCDGKE